MKADLEKAVIALLGEEQREAVRTFNAKVMAMSTAYCCEVCWRSKNCGNDCGSCEGEQYPESSKVSQ